MTSSILKKHRSTTMITTLRILILLLPSEIKFSYYDWLLEKHNSPTMTNSLKNIVLLLWLLLWETQFSYYDYFLENHSFPTMITTWRKLKSSPTMITTVRKTIFATLFLEGYNSTDIILRHTVFLYLEFNLPPWDWIQFSSMFVDQW